MALVCADFPSGQDGLYGSNKAYMLNGVWAGFEGAAIGSTTVDLVDDPDPNVTGKVFRTANANITLAGARLALPAGATTTVGIGVRLWLGNLPAGNWGNYSGPLIGFRTTGNSAIAYLTVLANGAIAVATGSGGTTLLGTTTTPVVTANSYNHIEVKLTRDASAGACEVRVNGAQVLDLSTLALGASDTGIIFLGSNTRNAVSQPIGCTSDWKDLVIWDASGTENNDFMGSVHIYDILPDADDTLNWTPSTGTTGWDLVDDNSGPDDTTYISAADTLPDPTIFTMTDLPEDVTSVRGLIAIGRMVKTDGGDCKVQMALSPNGTDWDSGADNPITVAETYWWDVSEVSPATSSAWTPTEVNALEFRFDRTL